MPVSKDQQRKNAEAFVAYLYSVIKNGLQVLPLAEHFTFDVGKPEKGKWYFAYNCKSCGRAAVYFEDPSEGAVENRFTGLGSFEAPCVSCKKKVFARVNWVRSMQWVWD